MASMLWQTPSLGATTFLYRIEGEHLARLASLAGDSVKLGLGTVTGRFENSGRSPNGRIENVYRIELGHFRLVG